jgi:hypothetical protein
MLHAEELYIQNCIRMFLPLSEIREREKKKRREEKRRERRNGGGGGEGGGRQEAGRRRQQLGAMPSLAVLK